MYTIGYGGRTPRDFIALLQGYHVDTIVDVRLRPDRAAMGTYVKAKSSHKGIGNLLQQAEIRYLSFVELGNIFRNYEDWNRRYTSFFNVAGERLLESVPLHAGVCLMCAERCAAQCHRKVIADWLSGNRQVSIVHIE